MATNASPSPGKKPWHVLVDINDLSKGTVQTLADLRRALDWEDDPLSEQLFHAQRLLDEWDLPDGLRAELEDFTVHTRPAVIRVPIPEEDENAAAEPTIEER